MGKTSDYYKSHPAARERKRLYDAEFNKKPSQVKKRVALNKYNRDNKDPKGNKTDAYHKGNRIVGYKSQSANRGSKVDSPGDRRARGGVKFRRKR